MTTGIDVDDVPLVDFTLPVAMSNFKMLVPAAKEESRLFAFIRPFQPEVINLVFIFNFNLTIKFLGLVIFIRHFNWFCNRCEWNQLDVLLD